ncbi:MAG: bifunctional molybdenum cofactor biosynthesis protein MoaC/MoaB [Ignavibacteria bacterium]|nr:bifunctional molybdenum cofactor biosynthesis protein MoaC/MoaB [Ignavibacteria bacterium]
MRDVSSKSNSLRTAKATATLNISISTAEAIQNGNVPKANPIEVARVAGIQAAKNTSVIIPYCHQVPLDNVQIDIIVDTNSISIFSEVKAIWKTGVEMEALCAVSATALTLYDMLKPIDETMEIVSIQLLDKKGGKSNISEHGEGLSAAVIVLSDSVREGLKEDVSGKILVEKLQQHKLRVAHYIILPDEKKEIENELKRLSDSEKIDVVITTGGTGISTRDVTPEATLSVIEQRLVGMEETLRSYGQQRYYFAMFSRCVVGKRGTTLIINLPGSTQSVEDGIHALFPHVFHFFRMIKNERHDNN